MTTPFSRRLQDTTLLASNIWAEDCREMAILRLNQLTSTHQWGLGMGSDPLRLELTAKHRYGLGWRILDSAKGISSQFWLSLAPELDIQIAVLTARFGRCCTAR